MQNPAGDSISGRRSRDEGRPPGSASSSKCGTLTAASRYAGRRQGQTPPRRRALVPGKFAARASRCAPRAGRGRLRRDHRGAVGDGDQGPNSVEPRPDPPTRPRAHRRWRRRSRRRTRQRPAPPGRRALGQWFETDRRRRTSSPSQRRTESATAARLSDRQSVAILERRTWRNRLRRYGKWGRARSRRIVGQGMNAGAKGQHGS